MRSHFLLMSLVAWLMLGACAAPTPAPESAPTPIPPASAPSDAIIAHNFALETLDGTTVALADLRGRWVVLNFWATWCGPCVEEMPYLESVAKTHADRLTVLGINMRETPTDVGAFVNALDISFPILLEPDNDLLLAYGPQGLPLTYLIAPDGSIAYKQFGPLDPVTFDGLLETALAE